MVKDDAGEGMVNTVVKIITRLTVAHCLSYYLREKCAGIGYHKAAGFGKYLYCVWKEPLKFGIQFPCKCPKRLYFAVVLYRESASDIKDVYLVSARLGFFED